MANDAKGLYLPLKIRLDEWEKDLSKANADLQKSMREMRSSVKDMKFQYDVKIAGAKAAGDNLKVVELENQKLNQTFDVQKQVVEALNRAYKESVRVKGEDAKESQALAVQLVRESKELDKIQTQINNRNFNFGEKISNSLANASPEFAKIRSVVSDLTSGLSKMGTTGIMAAKAVGGIGLAAASIGAVYTGLEKITNAVNDIAKAGVNASDPVYQLRESLQSSYEDAEFLFRVTKVDGSNAESLTNALVKLNSTLKKDADGTSEASKALAKYGAELLNADGTVKSYKEQLIELANAAQFAASIGQYGDFKAALPGAFRSTEFDHLLLGLQDYAKLANTASAETEIFYDKLHEITNWSNARDLAKQNLDAVKGGFFADASRQNLENEVKTLKATAEILAENRQKYSEVGNELGKITNQWTTFSGAAAIAWESIKGDIAGGIGKMKEFNDSMSDSFLGKILTGGGVGGAILDKIGVFDYFKEKFNTAESQVEERKQQNTAAEDAKKEIDNQKRLANYKAKVAEQEAKANEAAEKKRAEIQEKFNKELRDATATEYERQINRIEDQKKAYMEAGIAEVEANKLFAVQKEEIDKRYFEKLDAERQKQVKQAEESYKKEMELAKKTRESSISEAESTLKSNLKLLRYIKKEQEKGTYTEDNAKEYARKLYMRNNGFRQSDIDMLKGFGVDKLKDIANVRDRVFSDFATPTAAPITNNNNVNIQFDGTVVEDVAAMDKLANKVASVILPVIQNALRGGSEYEF